MNVAVYALSVAAFAIGTTEFVIMGLLPEVAADLRVTLPQAGWLISGYALGVAVGAPLLTVLGRAWPRKRFLMALMLLFIAGNVWAALAGGYWSLMSARVLASFTHGSFFGVGAVLAASLVPENKQSGAIALMFTGLTLANILGVPAGTALGQWLGWRFAFWAVAALGVIAWIALLVLVPRTGKPSSTPLGREFRALASPAVLVALGTTVFGFGGVFALFAYISPYLQEVAGFPSSSVSWLLLLFGLGSTVGNYAGGKLADRSLMLALCAFLLLLSLVQIVFGVFAAAPWLMAVGVFLWGVLSFAIVPPLQTRVVQKAVGAATLSSSLNIAAFNLGNALGPWAGGMALAAGWPMVWIGPVAGALSAGGLAFAILGLAMDRAAKR